MNLTTKKQIDFYVGLGNETTGLNITMKTLNVQHELARVFGGYSMRTVGGGWKDDKGDLVKEDSFHIMVIADEISNTTIKEVAEWLRDLFTQQSVMVNIQFVQSAFV